MPGARSGRAGCWAWHCWGRAVGWVRRWRTPPQARLRYMRCGPSWQCDGAHSAPWSAGGGSGATASTLQGWGHRLPGACTRRTLAVARTSRDCPNRVRRRRRRCLAGPAALWLRLIQRPWPPPAHRIRPGMVWEAGTGAACRACNRDHAPHRRQLGALFCVPSETLTGWAAGPLPRPSSACTCGWGKTAELLPQAPTVLRPAMNGGAIADAGRPCTSPSAACSTGSWGEPSSGGASPHAPSRWARQPQPPPGCTVCAASLNDAQAYFQVNHAGRGVWGGGPAVPPQPGAPTAPAQQP